MPPRCDFYCSQLVLLVPFVKFVIRFNAQIELSHSPCGAPYAGQTTCSCKSPTCKIRSLFCFLRLVYRTLRTANHSSCSFSPRLAVTHHKINTEHVAMLTYVKVTVPLSSTSPCLKKSELLLRNFSSSSPFSFPCLLQTPKDKVWHF